MIVAINMEPVIDDNPLFILVKPKKPLSKKAMVKNLIFERTYSKWRYVWSTNMRECGRLSEDQIK